MGKRIVVLCLLLVLVMNPAAASLWAQENPASNPRGWIPADYVGFMSLNTESLSNTFNGLNMALLVASLLQPTRADLANTEAFDDLFPLADQLDVPDFSVGQSIFPWLGDELIVAYKDFAPGLMVDVDDMLFILPTDDALQSANSFSRVVQAQDLLEREDYRSAILYIGDKTTFTIAPEAVVIGQTDAVKAVLDLMAGTGERLVDSPAYQAVASASAADELIFAYLDGSEALPTLSFLLSGSDTAEPLLAALGQALSEARGAAAFEQIVLGDALEGLGISLRPDTLRRGAVRATLSLYDADQPAPADVADFNADLLELIPQNALIVQNGTDAAGAVWDVLYALPLTNFVGQILTAFPVTPSPGALSGVVAAPEAGDLTRAVEGVLNVLDDVGNFDLEQDLLAHLGGSYSIALLPRPNNPTPFFNTPYDVLLIAETTDSAAALDGLIQLTQMILGVGDVGTTTIEDFDFNVIQLSSGPPLLTLGLVDEALVIATGDAMPPALAARRGDNRLISRPRWESISRDHLPQFYVDIPAFYSTFLPQPGGAQLRAAEQLGAWTSYSGDGLYQVQMLVTLPGEIGAP